MTNHEALQDMLNQLDEEVVEGLQTALETDPASVREYLRSEGFLHAGVHSEPELTNAETALLDVIEDFGNPKSSGEIQEIIEIEYPDKLEEYSSLKHRSWISDKLNSLVKKGLIGKYREGREVKFTADPAEAVRQWARRNEKFVSDVSGSDVDAINADTGMPTHTVRTAIKRLQENG